MPHRTSENEPLNSHNCRVTRPLSLKAQTDNAGIHLGSPKFSRFPLHPVHNVTVRKRYRSWLAVAVAIAGVIACRRFGNVKRSIMESLWINSCLKTGCRYLPAFARSRLPAIKDLLH